MEARGAGLRHGAVGRGERGGAGLVAASEPGVAGVALDGDRAKLVKFLQAKPLPWPQLHEPGGLDSRLAEEFGVLALPTMVLVGAILIILGVSLVMARLQKKTPGTIRGSTQWSPLQLLVLSENTSDVTAPVAQSQLLR